MVPTEQYRRLYGTIRLKIMPNMSYCRFENTAKDMQDCVYAIEERDVYEFSNYELSGFKSVLELAQEIVNLEYDIEKIIEYYEPSDTK